MQAEVQAQLHHVQVEVQVQLHQVQAEGLAEVQAEVPTEVQAKVLVVGFSLLHPMPTMLMLTCFMPLLMMLMMMKLLKLTNKVIQPLSLKL